MEEDRYLSYGQAYLFTDGRIGMVSVDDVAENPITQETDTLGTRIYLWEHRRSSPSRDDFGSFGGMLEAYGVDETGDSEEDFQHLSLEAERRGERIYPVGIYEHSLVRYYLDSVTDRNQTINGVVILDKEKIGKLAVRPEEYLKNVLETLTDWTNGDVYRVDMLIPKIILDGEDVFAKLVPDPDDPEHPREMYAPKTSDLTEYLPVGVGISCLIGETFYSIDGLRNYIEEPGNGMYLEILRLIPDKSFAISERESQEDRQEIEKDLERSRQTLTDLYAQQEQTKEELEKPFPQQEELVQKEARLAGLDAELNMDKGKGGEQEIADELEEVKTEEERTEPEKNAAPVVEISLSMDIAGLKKALMMPEALREQRTEKVLHDLLTASDSAGDDRISQMIRDGMQQGLSAVEQAKRIITDHAEDYSDTDNGKILYFQSNRQVAEVATYR